MELLGEIIHNSKIDRTGRTILREAARAVIIENSRILMVHSGKNGDYKFPGGGARHGESYENALSRELREECGVRLLAIDRELGKVDEYDVPLEHDYSVFKLTSYYFICTIAADVMEQCLDPYEQDLGFQPVWVDPSEAIQVNESLLKASPKQAPRWVKRETFVLKILRSKWFSSAHPL
jgi:ADP-ribose pyrophosphatase YjhB (NUDIX family)